MLLGALVGVVHLKQFGDWNSTNDDGFHYS
jgi:hypothetical protein